MRRRSWVLAVGAVVLLGLVAPAPGAGAAGGCLGVPLTLPAGTPTGTTGDDVMFGTPGPDTMDGLAGDDLICGGEGDDTIYGGGGRDTLVGGGGVDQLYGQGRCDDLRGGLGNDLLVPGLGEVDCNDTADGQGGRDRFVLAAVGFYEITGGPGNDTLDLRKMACSMTVNLLHHVFSPSDYPATESGVHEMEVVLGTPQGDDLYGDHEANVIKGLGGDDGLMGWRGDDRLSGGEGTDQVDGGDGHDVCDGETLWSCND